MVEYQFLWPVRVTQQPIGMHVDVMRHPGWPEVMQVKLPGKIWKHRLTVDLKKLLGQRNAFGAAVAFNFPFIRIELHTNSDSG